MEHQEVSAIVESTQLDVAIIGWLHSKEQLSQSKKTAKAYADTLSAFRAALHYKGLDLDSLDDEPAPCYDNLSRRQAVTHIAQQFAAWSVEPGKQVAASTHNQRLAILSSFYEHAIRREFLAYNPIKNVERAKVQRHKTTKALSREQTAQGLALIDKSTQRGKRDYALLCVYLSTGRRLSEVAALTMGDLAVSRASIVTLHFAHLKGGKEMSDKLNSATSKALLAWLHDYYGADLFSVSKTSPVFVSLAEGGRKGRSYGQPLGIRSISDICKKYLGTGKVHSTRHTWTKNMVDAGAGLPLIQQKLGHNSLATTSIYVEALKSADNPFVEEIARLAGIE